MQFLNYLKEEISMSEIKSFENKWLNKLKPMGLTNFEFSNHMGKKDFRVNDTRNNPPITVDELDFVMMAFVSKIGSQLAKDIQDVANHTAKKKGKNKQNIPDNNIEYTIISASTKINLAIALKQDYKQKGTAVIVPITIQRKKGWKTKQGVEVVVERRKL